MAKKSKIAKAKRQEKLVQQYAAKRAALKAKGDYIGLSKLPVIQAQFVYIIVTFWMGDRMLICGSLACPGLISVNSPIKAKFLGCGKPVGET